MPNQSNSQNLFDEHGLNITPKYSADDFSSQDDYYLHYSNRSSFQTTENTLESDVSDQRRKNSKSKNSASSQATAVDLVIQNAFAPSVANAGSTIQVSYQVKNKGKNSAGFNYTDFYISKDKNISSDDSLLGWNWLGSLGSGSSTSQSQNVSIDSNLAPGNYYILYRADALDNVLEISNTNNVLAREITITNTASGGYNSTSGYGLINASAAVAKATNQNTFADVPDLGGNNWGADLVKAPETWAQGYTGKGVVVAVLDTGVDYNHQDLSSNIWTNSKEIAGNGKDDDGNGYIDDYYGWNFDGNNNSTLDVYGHGTHVSGTIAGVNNGYGVTGIAYDSKIMPVKVLDDEGSGSNSTIASGIYYAVDNGADVINLSLGGGRFNDTLQKAIEYASNKGVIVVMAAGNDGGSQPAYPARYADKYGIAVGAVDQNKNIADFSNRAGANQLTYVTAPGVNVYSTLPGNEYALYSGTSMAAPHVAGVVALMLSANPNLSDAQIRQILAETSGNTTTQAANYSESSTSITENKTHSLSYDTNMSAISSFDNITSTWSRSYINRDIVTSASNPNSTNENHNNTLPNSSAWTQFWHDYKNSVIGDNSTSTSNYNDSETESIIEKRKVLPDNLSASIINIT
ncbi:MAG: S8 family serine peptidase [Pelatocladus maniniholoensis HA4357-MV3]|jgi:subtilisin|uniref:S8 family serine peptidase n=1 Tax=Pelatocladus maniniholoensis HA4357-MV3 TaxID=1117104 RepID=A0A9E3H9K4_9NOST|nr:S8 family serine peptidase [Pelatocladus maniniholoensis HA4357-MV3]BAZ67196.1 peptidase S8/S53 [Fischerella sp. NIES-4106]